MSSSGNLAGLPNSGKAPPSTENGRCAGGSEDNMPSKKNQERGVRTLLTRKAAALGCN